MITQIESQSILRLAQDCSSSLVGLEDVASFISEGTAAISAQFEFDDVLRSTLLYQAAERSHLRQAIRVKNPKDHGKASTKSVSGRLSTLGFKQAFQAVRPSIRTAISGKLSAWQGIRGNIRRDSILEPLKEDVTAETGSLRKSSHRHSRGGSSGIDLGPEQEPQLIHIEAERILTPFNYEAVLLARKKLPSDGHPTPMISKKIEYTKSYS